MNEAIGMPYSREEEEPSPEEPCTAVHAGGKGAQDQDYPETGREKIFLGNAKDAMDEHDLLDRLPAK